MASTPGFEPGPHWCKASALTSVPSLAMKAFPFLFFFSFPEKMTAKTTFINPFATGNFAQNRVLKLFVAIKSENLAQNRLQVGVVHFAAF